MDSDTTDGSTGPYPESAARWNFVAALIDCVGWGIGMGLVSATTVLPLFVRHLTPDSFPIGFIRAAMLFGWLLPGILVSAWIDRLPILKWSVVAIAGIERLALLVLVPLSIWLGPTRPDLLLAAFFACWLLMNTAIGANLPGYYKLIAKTIPPHRRGRLYGLGGALAGLFGIAAAEGGGWYLREWGFPNGFAACFAWAVGAQTLSVLPLAFMREPRQAPEPRRAPTRPWTALALLRTDSRLRWLVIAAVAFALNQMAGGFYASFAIDRFGADAAAVAHLNAVSNAARTVAFLLVGWMGDRHGNRLVLLLGSTAGIVTAGTASCAGTLGWMYPVFLINEVAVQAWAVCAMNYVLDLCPPERSATFSAVFGAATGPSQVLLPLVAAETVRLAGYRPVFLLAAVGGLAALALVLMRVREQRSPGSPAGAPG